jgi:hypothetical protein
MKHRDGVKQVGGALLTLLEKERWRRRRSSSVICWCCWAMRKGFMCASVLPRRGIVVGGCEMGDC